MHVSLVLRMLRPSELKSQLRHLFMSKLGSGLQYYVILSVKCLLSSHGPNDHRSLTKFDTRTYHRVQTHATA